MLIIFLIGCVSTVVVLGALFCASVLYVFWFVPDIDLIEDRRHAGIAWPWSIQ